MIEQRELRVKIKERGMAVTGRAGLGALVKVAQSGGVIEDLERRLGWMKRRSRGYSVSASVFDLMLLMCAGGECHG